ncbi:hypothetical protein Pcinc_020702 [Petrolisthes cinctipes]|uniref:Uncharacterized protein n=1 Tax=Petrolisthes cinctipes TaxID=88211 RepID=A0AAE1FHQ6_PETCI|nr:hypothetical protein Pcinc_020702 [Petrolisthes cinctipes]
MISSLLEFWFGTCSEEAAAQPAPERGKLMVFEGLEMPLDNECMRKIIADIKAIGTNVAIQSYPDFEAGESGRVLKDYCHHATKLTPHELLQARISNKIETYSKIESLLNKGVTVLCDGHWMGDVADAVSSGMDDKDCINKIPSIIKRMPDVVFLITMKLSDGSDVYDEEDASEEEDWHPRNDWQWWWKYRIDRMNGYDTVDNGVPSEADRPPLSKKEEERKRKVAYITCLHQLCSIRAFSHRRSSNGVVTPPKTVMMKLDIEA